MASCSTAQFGNTYCPQAKLTVTQQSSTTTSVTLAYTLQYVAYGYAAYTNGVGRAWSIVINGSTVKSGSYNINGVSSTTTIASGTVTVPKGTSAKNVSFSVSFNFDVTWHSVYGGTKSASSSISIAAKTSYTVSYDANGGSGAPSSQTKWAGSNLTLSDTIPTRTGYTFRCWKSSAQDKEYASGALYGYDASTTMVAQWTANTYQVTYNANGGSGAPGAQTKTHDVNLTLSSTKPTRTNYNFKGWGLSSSATTVSYSPGATYTNNATITLYAIWELAYWKPKITSLKVERCDSTGTLDDYGTYAKVTFNWECCQLLGENNASAIRIDYKPSSDTTVTSVSVTASGTSGSVSQIIGGGALSIDIAYDVKVIVTDEIGVASDASSIIAGSSFPIDVMRGGKGVAFGKPSEKEGYAEFEFQAQFNSPVKGKALGMSELTQIPSNADLNDYTQAGCYAVGGNATAETLSNIPVKLAGRLYVFSSCGTMDLENSAYQYREQWYIPCNFGNGTTHAWKRFISSESSTTLTYGAWYNMAIDAYPVGSYYISANDTSPAELFGGTWHRIESRFLWGAPSGSTLGLTAGEQTHTLTTSEMPSHSHVLNGYALTFVGSGGKWAPQFTSTGSASNTNASGYNQTKTTGSGSAHNNMPPYVNVAIWRREA